MPREHCQATAENSAQPTYGRKWGPWIEWDGASKAGPADLGESYVQVYRRSPNSDHWIVAEAHHIDWIHTGSIHDVLAYRVEL